MLLLEQMPEGLGQQVALFAAASAVVGLDGAWQNNILFMRPGARMVSLQPGDLTQLSNRGHCREPIFTLDSMNRHFQLLADALWPRRRHRRESVPAVHPELFTAHRADL